MAKKQFRKKLGIPGLLASLRKDLSKIRDPKSGTEILLVDCLMSGLAVFQLKYPSLLQFEKAKFSKQIQANLRNLYGVTRSPSDTQLRTRLDVIDPVELQDSFVSLYQSLQRGKVLERFTYLEDYLLLSIDGTEFFSSRKVHCDCCCQRIQKNHVTTYYHQMLSAAIVHPNHRQVFPLAPEPIQQQDGEVKNDCERNAAKRLISRIRRDHPRTQFIIVEDGLASNGPHIQALKKYGFSYILGAKPGDHKSLFNQLKADAETQAYMQTDAKSHRHYFRYLNDVSLNATQPDLKVNFLEYTETDASGKQVYHSSWVTDFILSTENLMKIMRAGRARWKIENETFNTLKNQGYRFEHNFGHGKQHLANVMGYLMHLAFLIDQIQQASCAVFQEVSKVIKYKTHIWARQRSIWESFEIPDWETAYRALAYGWKMMPIVPNKT